jgi:hypothetical protein
LIACESDGIDVTQENNQATSTENNAQNTTTTINTITTQPPSTTIATSIKTETETETETNQISTVSSQCDSQNLTNIFTDNSCTACHGQAADIIGAGLNLSTAEHQIQLINHPSQLDSCAGELLIDANNIEQSLLLKLIDEQRYLAWSNKACAQKMPPSGNWMPQEQVQCTQALFTQMVNQQNKNALNTDTHSQTLTQTSLPVTQTTQSIDTYTVTNTSIANTQTQNEQISIERGQQLYLEQCLGCHGDEQGHGAVVGQLTSAVCADCNNKTQLHDTIASSMPIGNSGHCSTDCAADIADYMFAKFTGYDANNTDTITTT